MTLTDYPTFARKFAVKQLADAWQETFGTFSVREFTDWHYAAQTTGLIGDVKHTATAISFAEAVQYPHPPIRIADMHFPSLPLQWKATSINGVPA